MKSSVLNYEMTDLDGAGLYCGTYRKYNDGSIYGMWIDLEQFTDAEDFFEVCRQLHDDEADPEFMFQDFQGFPREFYHESMNADDIQKILDYLQLDEDEREMLETFVECTGNCVTDFEELVEDAFERCKGRGFDSFRDFADQCAEEMLDGFEAACRYEYTCKGAAPMIKELREFFDYELYAQQLKQDFYFKNGYVFSAR